MWTLSKGIKPKGKSFLNSKRTWVTWIGDDWKTKQLEEGISSLTRRSQEQSVLIRGAIEGNLSSTNGCREWIWQTESTVRVETWVLREIPRGCSKKGERAECWS